MKVNMSIDVTDDTRRRIRAHFGRGGACTRSEFRTWLHHVIANSVVKLPEPKTRACNTSRRKDVDAPAPALNPSQAAAPDAVCIHCEKTKAEHRGRMLDCPLSKLVRPGSRFHVGVPA